MKNYSRDSLAVSVGLAAVLFLAPVSLTAAIALFVLERLIYEMIDSAVPVLVLGNPQEH